MGNCVTKATLRHIIQLYVGDAGSDVAMRMRFRYHAKLEFVKSQARQMLLRTAHNRTSFQFQR